MADVLLSDVVVNRQIQRKFCKVVSDYGEGTGYIINDVQGMVVSSFHLVGAIKPLKIADEFTWINIISILYAAGYIDEELRLKEQALQISTVDELISKLKSTEVKQKIFKKITVRPSEIKAYLKDGRIIAWIKQQIYVAQHSNPRRFQFSENHVQMKIACALLFAGYLDKRFCLTEKIAFLLQDLNSMIPATITFELLLTEMTEQEIAEAKNIASEKALMQTIFDFFQKGQHEKEAVLLSENVDIHIDDEVLTGRVDLPIDINETNKGRFLKQLAYLDTVPIKIIGFKNGKTLLEQGKVILTGPTTISPLPEHEDLVVGEKVYFGGYPLTQQYYTFSTGMIAAITYTEYRTSIVIEAPIAPGNSGSPLFIQRDGQVYWIGIINSEVACVSDMMIKIREDLGKMPEGLSYGDFGFIGAFREITTTLLDNLSTGKGKAFRFNLEALYNVNFINPEAIILDRFLDFLVPRRKPKPNTVRELAADSIKARNEGRILDIFEYEGERYYLAQDGHGSKHTKWSGRITQLILDNWHEKKIPATFKPEIAANYKEILKNVIITLVKAKKEGHLLCLVVFPHAIGWDEGYGKKGEETDVIELYFEDTGSHMRPKARTRLSREAQLIPYIDGQMVRGTPKCTP